MIIRRLKYEDIPLAKELSIAAFREDKGCLTPVPDYAQYPYDDMTEQDLLLGAFDGADLVGGIMAEFLPNVGEFKVQNFYVRPQYRRSNTAAGKACERLSVSEQLMEALLAMIDTSAPQSKSALTVAKGKSHAIRLYERFGFHVNKWASFGSTSNYMARPPFSGVSGPSYE